MNKCHLIKNRSELEFIFKNEKNKKFVMKVVSNEIEHKTEVGGVKLNIKNLDEALKSFDDITENILVKKTNIKNFFKGYRKNILSSLVLYLVMKLIYLNLNH